MAIAVETFEAALPTARSMPAAEALARRVEQTLLAALGIQIAFMIPSLAAYAIDERVLNGISVWSKPLKFQSSLIVLIGTLLLLLPVLRIETVAGRLARGTALAVAVSATLEIAYIVIQAARGRASHFNDSTQLEATLYQVMGVGAVTLVICTFIFGWLILRHARPEVGTGLRSGAAWSLMISAVLTLITAGVLSSGAIDGPGHWIGGIKSDAGGLFLLGWSRTGGDLRVPHFFATHIMQGLPLLGLFLDRFQRERAPMGIWIGALAGAAIVVATFVQAASGRPFL
jgi:hypothetical protein